MKRALRGIVGTGCILFGLFALVTPFTPGAWLALVGMELLGLSFLLPRPVRTRWDAFKHTAHARLHDWWQRRTTRRRPGARAWRVFRR